MQSWKALPVIQNTISETFLVGQWFLAVARQLRRCLNFLITILNEWCKCYIQDSGHFLEKIKTLGCIPDNAILVTADVLALYPSISHQTSLISLKEGLYKRLTDDTYWRLDQEGRIWATTFLNLTVTYSNKFQGQL